MALVGALTLLAASGAWAADDDAVAIIVNKGSSTSGLSEDDLRKIFKGEVSRTPEGQKYIVVMLESGAERDSILKTVYKMSGADYDKYFLQATFTGKVQSAPKQFSSAGAVLKFVAQNPGAIGYVRAGDVDRFVKQVSIDGQNPGDPSYKLKSGK